MDIRWPSLFGAAALTILFAAESAAQELPPEIQVDRLLIQAEREIEDDEHWSAVFTFERILAVCEEHGLEIPTEFWFRQAGVLQGAGLHERAVEAATRYLQEAGRDGEHYRAALEILDAAEVGLAEARRAETRARAAVERAEREIAAAIPEMVVIPAGTFRMGCLTRRGCNKVEKPVREVHVPSFALAKYELTFAQWDVCTEHGPCRSVPDEGWGRGARPVVNVSFDDVQVYLGWLSQETGASYRLPSEAEWEYAARAGTATKYSWGDEIGVNRANCRRLREPMGRCPDGPGGFVPAERVRAARHARQRVGVGGGLRERELRGRAGGWQRLAAGRVLRPRSARRLLEPTTRGSLRAAFRSRIASGNRFSRHRFPGGPDAHPLNRHVLASCGGIQGGLATL